MKKQKGSDGVLIKTGGKIVATLLKLESADNSKKINEAMMSIGTLTIPRKDARIYLENFIKENLHCLGGV